MRSMGCGGQGGIRGVHFEVLGSIGDAVNYVVIAVVERK